MANFNYYYLIQLTLMNVMTLSMAIDKGVPPPVLAFGTILFDEFFG